MRLSVVMGGGSIGGSYLGYLLDTTNMTAEVSQEISSAVEEADFFALPVNSPEPDFGGGPVYNVAVEHEDRRHTIQFFEYGGSPARGLVSLAMKYGESVPASQLTDA